MNETQAYIGTIVKTRFAYHDLKYGQNRLQIASVPDHRCGIR
jgi:hypothetical protein